ncbi:hypothetical protein DPV78_011805 [Talaromyces pinophilus]|nr:hypothetical protein DPV78_011805 [Talaromyces pinophilus]
MAFLPPQPMSLSGGCICKSVRYTINIPGLEDRSLVPRALPTPIAKDKDGKAMTIPTRFPLIDLDHCDSCRRASGVIVQCWFICPTSWVTWEIQATEALSNGVSDVKVFKQVPSILAIGPLHPQQQCEGAKSLAEGNLTQKDLLSNTFLSHYSSSTSVTRTFCSRCGTNLTYFMDRPASSPFPPLVDITVGSLDRESIEHIRPDRHCWWDEAISWIKELLWKGSERFLIRHPGGNVGLEVME